jgi:hypothetical protein
MLERKHWHPSITVERLIATCKQQMTTIDNLGLCLGCGAEVLEREPAARNYRCESCGAEEVFGAAELLLLHSSQGDIEQGAGKRKKMRIQSRHKTEEHELDAYFTCPEAIEALIRVEGDRMPRRIWEPAAGGGAIVLPLRASGRVVMASDIHDYGLLPDCRIMDYLSAPSMPKGWVEGVVTNPPFRWSQDFAERALSEVGYVAFLARTNFLMDSEERGRWLDQHEPSRTYYLLPRLPPMHREGWTGKRVTSNTPFAWVVWQRGAPREFPRRIYWREVLQQHDKVA